MDLEKFEREKLPRIKEVFDARNQANLIVAFEQAMAALREERERCAKIAEGCADWCAHDDRAVSASMTIADAIRRTIGGK